MDIETQKIYDEGQAISDLVTSRAWKYIEQKFTDKIMDLQNIFNITGTTPAAIAKDIQVRQLAVKYMYDLLRDIKGSAEAHEGNKALTQEAQDSIQIV
jgi:hypothetical protein